MITYTKARLLRLLKLDFIRFCIVGGTGFVINLALLTLLRQVMGLPIFVAQLVGAEIALFSNFMLHHHWTYKAHKVDKSMARLLVQFHASSWPAIIGSTITVSACERFLGFGNVAALIVSSTLALFWNFAWSKFVIWRDTSSAQLEKEIAE